MHGGSVSSLDKRLNAPNRFDPLNSTTRLPDLNKTTGSKFQIKMSPQRENLLVEMKKRRQEKFQTRAIGTFSGLKTERVNKSSGWGNPNMKMNMTAYQ